MDVVPTPPQEEDPIGEVALFAAMAYIPVLSLFFIKYRVDNAFMRFHSRQALVIFIFWVVNNIAVKVLPFLATAFYILNVVFLVIIVIGIFAALTGKYFNVPFITSLAEKLVV